MPYALIHFEEGSQVSDDARGYLLENLPRILALELAVEGRDIHDGGLSPQEIMLLPLEDRGAVNGKDIEIVVFVHPFAERIANIDDRKDRIIERIAHLFGGNEENFTLAVCIIMAPMAYGETHIGKPSS